MSKDHDVEGEKKRRDPVSAALFLFRSSESMSSLRLTTLPIHSSLRI